MGRVLASVCVGMAVLGAAPVSAQPGSAPEVRCTRIPDFAKNRPPVISIGAQPGAVALSGGDRVALRAEASDPDGDKLYISWGVDAGKIAGDAPDFRTATWTLTGVAPGAYTATLEVNDGHGCLVIATRRVEVKP